MRLLLFHRCRARKHVVVIVDCVIRVIGPGLVFLALYSALLVPLRKKSLYNMELYIDLKVFSNMAAVSVTSDSLVCVGGCVGR